MPYLFVHFKETYGTQGEQVYFSISEDGYRWETVNNGNAVLIADKGDQGVRDIVIARTKEDSFVILATDLALRRNEEKKYGGHIHNALRCGSKCLAMWKSNDLVEWSQQRLIDFSEYSFGCLWAPGIFYDEQQECYVVHWSSSVAQEDYERLSIYYSTTTDFETFSPPRRFCKHKREDGNLLDSCLLKEGDTYHFFVKSDREPNAVIHETGKELFGEYTRDTDFDRQMAVIEGKECMEAPTVYYPADGKACLMLDFYGCERKEDQGYRPYLMDSLQNVQLNDASSRFSFPYGFKHGVALQITPQEYLRIRQKKNW